MDAVATDCSKAPTATAMQLACNRPEQNSKLTSERWDCHRRFYPPPGRNWAYNRALWENALLLIHRHCLPWLWSRCNNLIVYGDGILFSRKVVAVFSNELRWECVSWRCMYCMHVCSEKKTLPWISLRLILHELTSVMH